MEQSHFQCTNFHEQHWKQSNKTFLCCTKSRISLPLANSFSATVRRYKHKIRHALISRQCKLGSTIIFILILSVGAVSIDFSANFEEDLCSAMDIVFYLPGQIMHSTATKKNSKQARRAWENRLVTWKKRSGVGFVPWLMVLAFLSSPPICSSDHDVSVVPLE